MASNIKFKRSAVQNRVPTTAQLDLGELALNTYDGKLYTEINTGSAAVVEIGSKLSSLVVDGANGAGGGDVVFHGATAARDLTWDYSDNALEFAENAKASFGNSGEIEIYRSGTESLIVETQGNNLNLAANRVALLRADRHTVMLLAIANGPVELYHNNSIRLTTTEEGVDIGGTGSLKLPVGTTAQRNSSPASGDIRFNSTLGSFEGYSGNGWGELGGGGIGIGSTSTNPASGVVANRIGVGFTDINVVGSGISVTGYGSTIVLDFNDFKPGSFHRSIHNYTATAGQTTFAGLNYVTSEKQIAVYLNGARLSEATYTATSGTTVVLDVGASLGDEVEIINIHTNSDVDRKVNTYTATAGQTTFTGLSYNSKQELDVYLNGIRLASADYTATSGNTVVLDVGASVNDIVDIVSTGDGITWRSTTDASGDRFTLTNVGIGTDQTPDKLNVRGNSSFVGVSTFADDITVQKHLKFGDSPLGTENLLTFGAGDDLSIFHSGNGSFIRESGTGSLTVLTNQFLVRNAANTEELIDAGQNSSVNLFFDGIKRFETTSTGATVTGKLTSDGLVLGDAETIAFGNTTNGDFKIYHDGSNASIQNITGNLNLFGGGGGINIKAENSEQSIVCSPNNQVELYFNGTKRFETTNTGSKVTGNLEVTGILTYDDVTNIDSVGIITARSGLFAPDNASLKLGNTAASPDLEIVHNSSENHFNVSQNTFFKGNVFWGVRNASNQGVIEALTASRTVTLYGGSSKVLSTTGVGVTVRNGLYIENAEFNMTTNGNKILDFETGGSNVVNFRHNPSDSGNTTFMKAIHGGAVELYHDASGTKKFNTTATGATITGTCNMTALNCTTSGSTGANFTVGGDLNVTGNIDVADDVKIKLGTSDDLQIYHDGSHSYIHDGGTGNLKVRSNNLRVSNADESKLSATFVPSGAVELYYNNSKKLETTSSGVKFTGVIEAVDNQSILLGTGQDFRIRHTGSHSEITDEGTGDLRLGANRTIIGNTAFNETQARFIQDGAVELYHNNVKKFETTSTGISVTDSMGLGTNSPVGRLHVHNSGTGAGDHAYAYFTTGDTGSSASDGLTIGVNATATAVVNFREAGNLSFGTSSTERLRIASNGHVLPGADSTYNLGSNGTRFANVYADTLYGDGSNITAVNATTLDSIDSGSFLRSDATDTASGAITFTSHFLTLSGHYYQKFYSGTQNYIHLYPNGHSGGASSTDIRAHNGTGADVFKITGGSSTGLKWRGHTIWTAENDGSGSGLDADTVDGIQASSFLRSDQADTTSGNITSTAASTSGILGAAYNTNYFGLKTTAHTLGSEYMIISANAATFISATSGNPVYIRYGANDSTNQLIIGSGNNALTWRGNKVFHAGNDGSGSGLDADTLDGVQGASFLRSDASDSATQPLTFSGGGGAVFIGGNSDIRFANGNWTGESMKIQGHSNYLYVQGGSNGVMIRGSDGGDIANFKNTSISLFDPVTFSGDATFNGGAGAVTITSSDIRSNGTSTWTGNPGASTLKIQAHSNRWYIVANSNSSMICQFRQNGSDRSYVANDGQLYHTSSDKYWRQGNDGSGSGLDADLLDGQHKNAFILGGAQSSVSGWHINGYRNGQGTSPHIYFSHSSGYGQHINTYNTSGSIYALQLHNNSREIFAVYNDGSAFHRGHTRWDDGYKAQFGTHSDLSIWHDGSHTRISHTGTGQLVISGNDNDQVKLMKGNSEEGIVLNNNGNVELYHNNDRVFYTETRGVRLADNTKIFENSSHNTAILQHADIHHAIVFRGATNNNGSTITNENTTTFREYGQMVFRTGGNGNMPVRLTIASNGVVSGNLNDTSDAKFKENIVSIVDGAISKIKQLRPVNFDWKREVDIDGNVIEDEDAKGESGFIAQEVLTVIPNLVKGTEYNDDEKTSGYSVNTTGLVAYLTKALQEAIARIEDLESKVNS